MSSVTIYPKELLQQIKLSYQFPAVIEGILTRKIIARAVEDQGITAEPQELQKAADELRLTSNLRSAEATWSWLQKHHLSLDDFEQLVELTVISSKLAQSLFADKVDSFFVENQLDYAQVFMYEVVFDDEELAMEIFYAIGEGESGFHEVAHQYILDSEQRRFGGYRGVLSRQDLKPEISAAVFAINPPQLLKPIVTSQGIHLIFVEELIPPKLDNVLYYKIILDLFSEWLKQQIEKFNVEIDMNLNSSRDSELNPQILVVSS